MHVSVYTFYIVITLWRLFLNIFSLSHLIHLSALSICLRLSCSCPNTSSSIHLFHRYLLNALYPRLEKEMATHSNVLAWKVPWTEESGRFQSIGSQRVGHNWVTNTISLTLIKDLEIQGHRCQAGSLPLWSFHFSVEIKWIIWFQIMIYAAKKIR